MAEAPRPQWLPSTGPGNLNVCPEEWGMQVRQWAAFIMTCFFCTEKWEELAESEERKESGYCNLYQICDHFVKPWTRNLGNSIALLMNEEKPLKAELMVSHAWGECILEALVAVLGKASVSGISLNTVIWFCTFAQYQPGDMEGDCGPGVAAQLALDPFKCVIKSKPRYGMLVIHTSRAELYGRLWCVYEINEAQISDVLPISAYSFGALEKLKEAADAHNEDEDAEEDVDPVARALKVDAENAECWSKEDADMIKGNIVAAGGFDQINTKIFDFRMASIQTFSSMFNEFTEWAENSTDEETEENHTDVMFESLMQVARGAALFVALHCLSPFVEQAEDRETADKMIPLAQSIVDNWKETFDKYNSPPPNMDVSKIGEPPESEEEVAEAIGDIGKCPFAIAILEMAAGGSAIALAKAAIEEGSNSAKEAFAQWDDDGSGTISKEELGAVLLKLNPEFSEQDIDIMFQAADANKDGSIDVNEFVDWLSGGLVKD